MGTRWIMFAGLAMLVLAAGYTIKWAADQGWINETARLLIVAGVGLAMVGLGEYWQRSLRLFAAGISAGGIVLLYLVVFAASPNGAKVMGSNYLKLQDGPALVCMCLVTVGGVVVAVRNGLLLSGVLSLIGALATPVLLSTGHNAQVGLLGYLLLVNAGFLVLAVIKRWQALAPLALAGTAMIFTGWFATFGEAPDSPKWVTSLFGWLLMGLYVAYGIFAARTKRADDRMAPSLVLVMMVLMGCMWMALGQASAAMLSQMLVLNLIVLALCVQRRWLGLAALAMGQSVAMFAISFDRLSDFAGVDELLRDRPRGGVRAVRDAGAAVL